MGTGSLARSGGFRTGGPSAVAATDWQDEDASDLMMGGVEKRHISSLARLGMFRPSYSSGGGFYRASPQKRHIGALAKSGWLSSFRPIRSSFTRAGRARSQIVGS